jgi:hypothetical protein
VHLLPANETLADVSSDVHAIGGDPIEALGRQRFGKASCHSAPTDSLSSPGAVTLLVTPS